MSPPATRSWMQFLACLSVVPLGLAACRAQPQAVTPAVRTAQPETSATVSSPTTGPVEPSATPAPLAAVVNGQGITQAEYQAELSRFQSAAGREPTQDDQKVVLDYLIDQLLLAQGAAEKGFTLDEAGLQARLKTLEDQMGGADALTAWLAGNNYSEETLRQQLTLAASASWLRDQIAEETPAVAEHVHARQILSRTQVEAEAVLAELQNGADFADLATAADPQTGGEMGWFPLGGLYDANLAQAAFDLQPDQFSAVVQTLAGFHILQVIERDPARPYDPQALLAAQQRAVLDWLAERRQQSQVEILLP